MLTDLMSRVKPTPAVNKKVTKKKETETISDPSDTVSSSSDGGEKMIIDFTSNAIEKRKCSSCWKKKIPSE